MVEGYYAVDSARELAKRAGVEMPITQAAYQVLYEGRDPQDGAPGAHAPGKAPRDGRDLDLT